jgi:hypothetical protein
MISKRNCNIASLIPSPFLWATARKHLTPYLSPACRSQAHSAIAMTNLLMDDTESQFLKSAPECRVGYAL